MVPTAFSTSQTSSQSSVDLFCRFFCPWAPRQALGMSKTELSLIVSFMSWTTKDTRMLRVGGSAFENRSIISWCMTQRLSERRVTNECPFKLYVVRSRSTLKYCKTNDWSPIPKVSFLRKFAGDTHHSRLNSSVRSDIVHCPLTNK